MSQIRILPGLLLRIDLFRSVNPSFLDGRPSLSSALLVQNALRDQLVDRLAHRERGVELYTGFGPEQALAEPAENLLQEFVLCSDGAAYIRAAVVDQSAALVEHIYKIPPPNPTRYSRA